MPFHKYPAEHRTLPEPERQDHPHSAENLSVARSVDHANEVINRFWILGVMALVFGGIAMGMGFGLGIGLFVFLSIMLLIGIQISRCWPTGP